MFDNVKRFLNNCESYKEYVKFIVLIAKGRSVQRIGFDGRFDYSFWKMKLSCYNINRLCCNNLICSK